MTARARRVVVVGGGVSGLAAAYRLTREEGAIDVTVLEADSSVGGKLRSVTLGDLVLPAGADSFLARKPWAVDLCRELGIADSLEGPGTSGAYLWTDRGLVAFGKDAPFGIPGDVGDVMRWPGLSRAGRRRALTDLVRGKRKDESDETLGTLLRRRLGDEATDLAVAPLLAGLFAGDIDRLSVQATFPELARWEASQGSLIRGSQAATRDTRRHPDPGPMFLRPRGGVEVLTDALAQRVGPGRIHTGARVEALGMHDGGFTLTVGGGSIPADAVVLAPQAHVAAGLLAPIASQTTEMLATIPYASTAAVLLVYPQGTARQLPAGTGFLVPRGKAPMTASTWLSNKWPSSAFDTRAVIRCYVGAVGEEDILDAPDDDLIVACERFLAAVVPLPAAAERAEVVRWPASMPQYELGHLDRVAAIRAALPPGIFVTGQAYDGVGIPDCVRGAGEAAEAALAHLAGAPTHKETVP